MTQAKVHSRGKVSDKESGKCSAGLRKTIIMHTPLHYIVKYSSPGEVHGSVDPQLSSQQASSLTDEQGLQYQSSRGSERFVWFIPLRTILTKSYYCVQEHPVRLLQLWGGSLERCYIIFWQLGHHFHWKRSHWKEVTFQCSLICASWNRRWQERYWKIVIRIHTDISKFWLKTLHNIHRKK